MGDPVTGYRIVVIDDERVPDDVPAGVTLELYRTLAEGTAALKAYHRHHTRVDELWLDHDLGENDEGWDTIMPLVNWMEEIAVAGDPLRVGFVFVHTSSPPGAMNMLAALKPYYQCMQTDLPVKSS